jgi:hypothetical protein
MLTLRSLSGMMRDRSLLLLFGLAAAALFLIVANPGQAFAELSPTHSQNAAANTAADQSTTSPRVFSRSIGDSVAVASTFDNLGARVPRVFNVGISDGLNIATSPTPPPPSGAATSTTPRPSAGLQGAGRAEEKLGPRNPAESKGDLTNNKDQKNGSVQEQPQSSISQELESVLSTLMQDLLGSDDSEPDDSNSSPQVIPVQVPPTIYIDSLYGAYAIAVIAISVAKSPRVVSMKRRIVALYAVEPQESKLRDAEMSVYVRVAIIVVVMVAAIAMASVVGPVMGEAFADSNSAGAVYRSNDGTNLLQSPKYREWNPSTLAWSSQVELPTTGSDVRDAKIAYSPNSSERAVVSLSADGTLNLFVCDNSCTTASKWTRVGGANFADVGAPSASTPYRYFDLAYEQSSGELMIVYDKTTTSDTNDFFYRTYSDGVLSGESGFDYVNDGTSDNDIRYFNLAAKSGSNELTMVLEDATAQDAIAMIWSGSSWGNVKTISSAMGTTSITGEAIGVAYETTSGASVVFSGNGADSAAYARWTGTWSSVSTTDPNSNSGNDVKFVTMKSDPASGSNKIMICQVDDLTDLTCRQINGGTLSGSSWTNHDTGVDANTSRPADFAWNPSGSTGLVVWGTTSGSVSRNTFNGGTNSWGTAGTTTYTGTTHPWVVALRNPTDADTINSLWLVQNSNFDIGGMKYDGTTLTLLAVNTFTADTVVSTFESMGIDFQKSKVVKRSIADTLTITPAVAMKVQRTLTNTIAVTPSVVGAKSKAVSISQTITIAPTIATKVSHSLPNTLTASDSIARSVTVTPDSNVAGMAYRSDDGTNGSSSPKYREWNPTTKTWSSQVELESAGSPIRNAWIEFSPVSIKRVIIVLSDDGTLDSYVCDFGCTTPGNWAVTHDIVDLWNAVTPAIQKRPFDIEFEKTSGDLMLVYDKEDGGDSTTDLFYRIMPDSSTTFGSENAIDDTGSGAPDNVYSFVRLDSRKTSGSNDLGLVAASETNHRAVAWYFNGATQTFGNINTLTTSTSTDINYEGVGVAFETSTGDLVAVAADGADVVYSQFSGGSWSSISTVGSMDLDTVKWVRLVPNPNAGRMDMQLVASGPHGSFNGLSSAYWSGSAWTVYDSDGAPVGSDDNLHAGTTASNSIDSTETRVFDFAWNNADDSLRGILVWGKSNQLSFKRFAATSSWTSALTITDDGSTHPWVSLNEHTNPTSADAVSVLGAAIDSDADISQLRWDGGTTAVFAWTDDGASTVGNTSPESFHVDFRRSPVLKKFPSITLTVADALAAKMRAKVFPESVTIVVSVVAEKGSPLDSARSAAVYRSGTGSATFNSPKYREWDPATQTWSAEVELPNTGSAIRDAIIRFSSDSSLRVVVSHSSDGTLNLFTCDNNCTSASSWTLVAADFADTGSPDPSKPYRPYDMLFETTGERLVIVYDKELTENADFYYRTFDGTTLSAETGVNLAGGSADAEELRYLHLAAHSTTNEMTLAVLDATNLKTYGAVWNGSAWGNVQTVSSSLSLENIDGDSVDVAYEAQSGASLVLSGNGQNSAAYARWTGASWTTGATNPNPGVTTEDVKFVSLKSDPLSSSNKIMACQSDDGSALSCSQFNAGTPGTWTVVTGTTGTTAGRAFDFAYNPAGTTGLLVSSSGASGTLDYRAFNGTAFGTAATLSAAGTHKWVLGASAISTTDVVNSIFLKSNSNFDTGAIKSKAGKTTLVGDASLTSESGNDTYESMHIDFQKSKKVKRASADTIIIVPSVARGIGKSLSDTVTIAPAVSKGVRKPLSDTINISAVAAKNPKVAIPIAISVSDSVGKKVTRSLPSTITIQDSITTITIVRPSVTLSIADSVAGHKGAARSVSDAANIGVSVSWMYHASRSASDTLSVSTAVSTTLHPTRSVSVTLSVADAITKSTTKSLSDAVTVLPSVSRTYSTSRSISDTVTVSPAVAKVYLASRSAAEVVSVSDAVAGTSAFARAIADSVSLADAAARQSVAARSAADAITVSDAISSRTLLASRSLADTLSASDSINKSISRSVSDAVSIADVIIKSATRSLSETLSATDAISPTATRPLSSTITITDAISHSVSRSLSDSVAVADSIAKRASRSLSDTLSAADSVSRRASRAAAETVSIADAIATTARRSLSDSLSVTDTISPSAIRALADSVTLADAIATKVSRSLEDSFSVAATLSGVAARPLSSALTVTDAISIRNTRSVSDSVTVISEILQEGKRSVDCNLSISDSISTKVSRTLSDSLSVTASTGSSINRLVSDSISLADTVSQKVSRALSDTLAMADAVSTRVTRSLSEALGLTDAVAKSVSRSTSDSIAITEAVTTGTSRSIADTLTLADSTSRSVSRSLADALSVADAISRSASYSTSDTVSLADAIATLTSRSLVDAVGVTDAAARTAAASRGVSDAITVSPAITPRASYRVAESVMLADSISVTASRSLADSVAVTDSVAVRTSHPVSDAFAVTDTIRTTTSRSLSDSVLVTETVSTSVSRSLADALSLADAITKSASHSLSDSIIVTDAITKSVSYSLTETVGTSDAITRTVSRSLSDSFLLADAITTAASRSIADMTSIADAIVPNNGRSISDTLALSDSITRSTSRSVSETLSATDAISTTASRSLTDSITVADATGRSVSRSIADTLTVAATVNSGPSRSATDSISLTDTISTSVSRSIADSVTVISEILQEGKRSTDTSITIADAITTKVSRSLSDALSVTESMLKSTSLAITDTVAMTDAITGKTSRSTSDTLSATDAISTSVSRSLSDAVSMTDSVTSAASRTMQETLSVTDTAATNAPRSPSDLMTVEDAIATSTSRSLSDAVGVTDAASSSTSVLASVSDSLAVADSILTNNINRVAVSDSVAAADSVTGALAASRLVADALMIEDATGAPTSFAREISDSLVIADGVSGGSSISVPVSDSLAMSDAIARTGSGPFSDAVAVADSVSIGISRFLADAMPMADSVALPIPRTINDALVLADQVSAKAGTAVSVVDSLGVNSQITDVSVHWNRVFEEGVDLADCTPFSCNQSLHFDEGLNLADGDFFTSPPGRILPTTLAVTDSIAVNRPQTFITLGDSAAVSVAIKPLLPILVNDHADNHGRPPNLSVPGTYTWDGTPADLRDAIELEPLYFNTTVIRDDLPNQIITLRLRDVTIVPTADLPANNTLISDRAASIPAGVPVQVRVNFMDTPALSGHSGFIQSLDVQFTPAMLTTDFGLIVTPMDVPPAGATLPPEELRPLYIDVRWWGNVPGGSDPSVQSYYQHPPTFTFTVTDDWARSESAARDANGVPLIKIRLLNEGTNQWEEINTVQNLSAGNGTYTFTATLPHFSDYVITAVKSATAGSGTGTSSSHVPPPPVVPKTFAVNLADSLTLATSTSNKAVAVIEEFVNEKFSARLLDSVKISSRPVAYNTFTILKDVDVSITVVDVKQKDVAPPSATAVLQTDITNAGDQAEKFTLNFWYNDQTGKRAFDLSQQVEVEAHGSKTLQVTIPFTEPGTYRVTAEARSVPENDLLESTQLTVVVPWLSVYLYVLMTVAIAILGGSAIAIALYMARNGMMITAAGAGTAGALILLLGRKRKPRVRVAERKLADNDDDDDDNYDLLVNVKLANGSEGRLAPGERMALFDFEIINRSRRKQEFVLAYHLVDMAGTTMPESAAEIKIGKRKTQLCKAKIELLAGAYVLHVEARTAKGEVLSSDRVSVRTA